MGERKEYSCTDQQEHEFWKDYFKDVTIELNHYEDFVDLLFYDTFNEDRGNESWGITNF